MFSTAAGTGGKEGGERVGKEGGEGEGKEGGEGEGRMET